MPTEHDRVQTIRRFNRLYTSRIGLLQNRHLGTPFSLTEARLLFELAQRPALTAKQLCDELSLDQGYVSRLLSRFEKQGLISRTASKDDARAQHITLTNRGRQAQALLDAKATESIAALLKDRPEAEQNDLAGAAETFLRLLGPAADQPVIIRQPRSGDIGWIIHRHGTVIAAEFGWDSGFEVCVAGILSQFGRHPGREQGWIAERGGRILGSVFVMPEDETTARLRVLYVEAAARGLGLGRQLVDHAIRFARETGYSRLVLWTHQFQSAARNVYQAAGFSLLHSEATRSFGVDAVSETWAIEFRPPSARERSPA